MVGCLVNSLFFLEMVLMVARRVMSCGMAIPPQNKSGLFLPTPASAALYQKGIKEKLSAYTSNGFQNHR
jgi:hypothetical protein